MNKIKLRRDNWEDVVETATESIRGGLMKIALGEILLNKASEELKKLPEPSKKTTKTKPMVQ